MDSIVAKAEFRGLYVPSKESRTSRGNEKPREKVSVWHRGRTGLDSI